MAVILPPQHPFGMLLVNIEDRNSGPCSGHDADERAGVFVAKLAYRLGIAGGALRLAGDGGLLVVATGEHGVTAVATEIERQAQGFLGVGGHGTTPASVNAESTPRCQRAREAVSATARRRAAHSSRDNGKITGKDTRRRSCKEGARVCGVFCLFLEAGLNRICDNRLKDQPPGAILAGRLILYLHRRGLSIGTIS